MTWEQIINHPLIKKEECVKDYDGKGKHMVVAIDGYRFESFNSTIEIGNLRELTAEIKERLHKNES